MKPMENQSPCEMILRPDQLEPDRSILMIIDAQEKLLPLITSAPRIVSATRKLLAGARLFHLPILVTEQYPRGLGRTEPTLDESLTQAEATFIEKTTFSACGELGVRSWLAETDRSHVVLVGVETHVCVLQTAMDLAMLDYKVFVCADATGSRGALDHDVALARMRHEGIHVTTVESVLFELCRRCGTESFKKMIEVIKSAPPHNAL
jgi:nicotinamidase-related amidase